jgi:zinc transport system substrate-binding protein
VDTTTLPQGRIADSTAGLHEQLIVIEEKGTHSHGKEGEHTHRGTDPHTWSDPEIARAQAEAIRDALIAADPDHTADYEVAYKALAEDLGGLDAAYRGAMLEYHQEVMATSHPAFNYLGRRYGLHLIDFGFEPDAEPTEMELQRLKDTVAKEGITVLLWEAKPTPEVQATFDEMGLMSVFLDPLEQPGEGAAYDYLVQAKQNVAVLQGLFGGEVKPVEESAEEPAQVPTTP